jgi:putative phage-type endonuclease
MLDLIQGSEAWKLARCGSVGASSIADLMAQTKGGWSASRANLMARLIAERMTGVPQESYVNAAMAHGTETEPDARRAYAFIHDADVAEVGLVPHPTIKGAHASPDGLVGADGLLEIKCPNTATHIDTLLSQGIADKYVKQMQFQLACTGRTWCDFVSFDPRMRGDLQLFVKRVPRDDALIAEIEDAVRFFIIEMEARIRKLEELAA